MPPLRWDAPGSFAAANRISTTAGTVMVRDALVLHHRLPKVWARVVAGQVPVFRARRIAQAVLGQADDVTAYVDREVVDRAHSIGLVTLDRVLDESMLRLHAEEREIEQLEALDHRYARIEEQSPKSRPRATAGPPPPTWPRSTSATATAPSSTARSARDCDADLVIPFKPDGSGGPTCACNLASC